MFTHAHAHTRAHVQELADLEEELAHPSDNFYKNMKLVVIDSMGAAFAPIIGGTSHMAYALLVSVVQTLQVSIDRA